MSPTSRDDRVDHSRLINVTSIVRFTTQTVAIEAPRRPGGGQTAAAISIGFCSWRPFPATGL
jgi:hypothetical protein